MRCNAPPTSSPSCRLVKRTKLYFVDTGLLCHLLGIRKAADLATHPLRGSIFENFVITELRKLFLNQGLQPPLFFFRDSHGHEVDVIIDLGTGSLPIEIEAGETVASDAFKGLDYYTKLSGDPGGILVYAGLESYPRKNHQVRGWTCCS